MHITLALKSLGITQCTVEGNPKTEAEFRNAFKKVASIDADGNPTFTDDWGFTWPELQAELNRLQAEYDAKQYQRDRAKEYPSFADQFDTLYHGGYDAWKAQIDAIKAKYPKP